MRETTFFLLEMKQYYVYIVASKSKDLYIGVTSDLMRRLLEHKQKKISGHTKKYNINQLVYFEETNDVSVAFAREKYSNWKNFSYGWFND